MSAPGLSVVCHASPSWGEPLTKADYSSLAQSWLTQELADEAGLRRVGAAEGRQIVGQKGNRDCSGILIPYYWPGAEFPHTYRLRRDKPEMRPGSDGKPKPSAKYLAPPGDRNRLYIPPGVTLDQLNDPNVPIALVEGEKKALALLRLSNHCSVSPRFIPIAISGVWNWRGKIGKTCGPDGESVDVNGPIADLNRVPWEGRTVFIVFDTNVHTNESVKWARAGINRELTSRRAVVKLVNLPPDCGVNGIDDLLAKWGPERVLELFNAAASGARLDIKQSPQYRSSPDGMVRETNHGDRLSQIPLTNFVAKIISNIQLDDGVETKREFEIEASLFGRPYRFTVPASEFVQMNWAIERLGAAAIVFPNQREYAKTAIQSLSVTAHETCIYTHTGWRTVHGQPVYLHAGGAIGTGGYVPDLNVRLSGALTRYVLQQPSSASALTDATQASLRLLQLGPSSISFPLLAATARSVLGDADFSLHLTGESGTFKSEVAALHQQFFGAAMNRLNLPGSWTSTSNALETLAFHAKDALLVIDDFAPQGGSLDVARYHSSADRVFRAAGNHAGRGRLDSTAKLREPKPPRALILSTGEEVPRGQSIRARLLILEISKGNIKSEDLAKCQSDARAGFYALSMAGFLQWLAGRFEEARAAFKDKVADHRSRALTNTAHARTPDILANLQAAFDLFVEFSVKIGAIDPVAGSNLIDVCWNAICEAAESQSKHQRETEPATGFLGLIRSLLSSGRAHLAARNGSEPEFPSESCGWRRDRTGTTMPSGDRIGWIDAEHIFLEPGAAFRAAQLAARDSGDPFAISGSTLTKRLREKGLLASTDEKRETLTVRRMICGSSHSVLHFRRDTILPAGAADESEGVE